MDSPFSLGFLSLWAVALPINQMSLSRHLLRKPISTQILKLHYLRSLSTTVDTQTALEKNLHQQNHKFLSPSEYLNSWKPPRDPPEAEAKLALLRREYAKKVKEVREDYIKEMEVLRQNGPARPKEPRIPRMPQFSLTHRD